MKHEHTTKCFAQFGLPSRGYHLLVLLINCSNLALTNRVYSGQASSRIKDYPNCAKPGTLCARQFNPVYMFGRLMQIFIDCSDLFLVNERNLILSGVSERCLCGSFMLILRRALDNSEFANYYSDIEYNRNFNGLVKTIIDDNMEVVNITCDLIIHSRGEIPKQDNLIAIEMKRDNHPEAEKEKDRIRLRALTKSTNDTITYLGNGVELPRHVCGYVVGVFYEVSIASRHINIEYYQNGELHNRYVKYF